MIHLSVIILSKTNSNHIYNTTMNCIISLVDSEDFNSSFKLEIILVESNANYLKDFQFPEFVKVIVPNTDFGFHKFLNIGVKEANGNFIALCNNDLIFHKNWFTEILKIDIKEKVFSSFSPIDPRKEIGRFTNSFDEGYKVTQQIKGWCLVCKKEMFNKYKSLDENFKFFYSDNDYALSLLFYNLKHAVVSSSHVSHLHKVNSSESVKKKDDFFEEVKINQKIPKQLYQPNLKWILNNKRVLFDYMTYYEKWGNTNSTYRAKRYALKLNNLGLNPLVKLMFIIKRKFKL